MLLLSFLGKRQAIESNQVCTAQRRLLGWQLVVPTVQSLPLKEQKRGKQAQVASGKLLRQPYRNCVKLRWKATMPIRLNFEMNLR